MRMHAWARCPLVDGKREYERQRQATEDPDDEANDLAARALVAAIDTVFGSKH